MVPTSVSRRPQLSVVIFDAVGTLIHPVAGVVGVYHRAGQRFGSQLSHDDIKSRFQAARKELFQVEHRSTRIFDGELDSSDGIEKELWRQLVSRVFSDVADCAPLFDHLWSHFAQPENWRLYPDVDASWAALRRTGLKIGIGSNFDTRLLSICEYHAPLDTADWVFCSAEVGYRKPDLRFYKTVEERIQQELGDRDALMTMVGDNFQNDVSAPARLGWGSMWLDRNGTSAESSIPSLAPLPQWIENRGG